MSEIVENILDSMLEDTFNQIKNLDGCEFDETNNSCLLPYSGHRVLSYDETLRLSKASYQFISRIQLLGILPDHIYEQFLHELLFSQSEFILLEEVRFIFHMVLEEHYNAQEINFIKFAISKKQQECSIVH